MSLRIGPLSLRERVAAQRRVRATGEEFGHRGPRFAHALTPGTIADGPSPEVRGDSPYGSKPRAVIPSTTRLTARSIAA